MLTLTTNNILLEEIKNKILKIDIFSAIYINIKVVTTKNSKIGLQRSLQNLMLDFSKKNKSQIVQEFSSENDFEPRFLFHSTVACPCQKSDLRRSALSELLELT